MFFINCYPNVSPVHTKQLLADWECVVCTSGGQVEGGGWVSGLGTWDDMFACPESVYNPFLGLSPCLESVWLVWAIKLMNVGLQGPSFLIGNLIKVKNDVLP